MPTVSYWCLSPSEYDDRDCEHVVTEHLRFMTNNKTEELCDGAVDMRESAMRNTKGI